MLRYSVRSQPATALSGGERRGRQVVVARAIVCVYLIHAFTNSCLFAILPHMSAPPFDPQDRRLMDLSSRKVILIGLVYFLVVALIDHRTPSALSLSLFHLLGVLFVGWGAGPGWALLLASLSVSVLTYEQWLAMPRSTATWMLAWNAGSRFLVFAAAGWLAAEVGRLTRRLQSDVAERTSQLKAEAAALRDSEARLRATINSAPIVLFAVDGKGIITFEDGHTLKLLGVRQGENVGKSVFTVFSSYPDVLQNVRRALAGEEFDAILNHAGLALHCWYHPNTGEHGMANGFTGVAIDISARLTLERQILEIRDREQARIGQDIHDGLCQQLVSLGFGANALVAQLDARHQPEAQKARAIAELLDASITEARQVSRGLFLSRLESDGLSAAIEDLAEATSERFQIDCHFESGAQVDLSSAEAATHLYRIAQEAVNNAVKHSRARTIVICLKSEQNRIELRVEDDGSGMGTAESNGSSGMGLQIMDYRARSIGANLQITAKSEGNGTVVSCTLPAEANGSSPQAAV